MFVRTGFGMGAAGPSGLVVDAGVLPEIQLTDPSKLPTGYDPTTGLVDPSNTTGQTSDITTEQQLSLWQQQFNCRQGGGTWDIPNNVCIPGSGAPPATSTSNVPAFIALGAATLFVIFVWMKG